jgi:oligosaccharide repeat unit polymerase
MFYITYERYPSLYGIEDSNIDTVNGMLVIGSIFYTIGTTIIIKKKPLLKHLQFEKNQYNIFDTLLATVITIICITMWIITISKGTFDSSTSPYGQGQWNRIDDSPWLRITVLLVPLFSAYITLHTLNKKNIPWLFFISIGTLIAYPAIKGGGRKDILFIALVLIITYTLKVGKNRIKPLIIFGLALTSINYAQVTLRENFGYDSDSLLFISEQKDENKLIGQISTVMPIAPTLSSAMMAFPKMHEHDNGLTFIKTLIGTLVPKIITENFNFPSANQAFHDLYYPEVNDFSMDYSLAAEFYQNFGSIGVFIGYFILGATLSNAFRLFKTNPQCLTGGIYMVLYFSSIWFIRSDSNTFFKTLYYPSILLLLIFFLSRKIKLKTK